MPLNAKTATGGTTKISYPPMDAGAYPARVVQIIDLGVQPQEYKGEEKTPRQMLMITYEFLDEFLPDDEGNPDESKPRWLSEQIPLHNLNSERAKSTQRYYALDPNVEEDGDFTALVNRPCTVTVIQNKVADDKVYNNIAGISAMRAKDADRAPELVNPPKVFVIDNPDMEIFGSLPDWVQTKIKDSLEYAGSPLEALLKGGGKGGSLNTKKAASDALKASKEDDDINW